jgi:hypothetical protein
MNVLLTLDGVLSSESGEPNRTGVLIYYALNEGHRVTIITSKKKADAEHWLKSHGIIGYDNLVGSEMHLEGEDLRKRQFLLSRSMAPVELYVDSDPAMCAWVFENQLVPILLLANPSYLPVENRPDAPSKVRKWSDIEAAIDKANVAKSEQRIKPREAALWDD